MSTQHNIMVIYGFKADSPISRDRKTGECFYLADWLLEHYPELSQINAGVSNGGSPDFFVGVVLEQVKDYTRSNKPYQNINGLRLPNPHVEKRIIEAREALEAMDATLVDADAPVGFYLVGDAA